MSLAPQESSQSAPPAELAPAKPRVVALLNQKGGVGKTTSTVNLGAALARFGQRVLLIDLDPQSNLSLHFGVEPRDDQPSVHELLVNEDVRVEDVVVNARPGLDFVPAVTELALVEGELANRPDMQHVLRRKLESAWGRYDVVLLDCPPSLGVLSVNALTVADEVFVPMQAHYLPLRGLEKLLQTVHMVSQGLNPRIRVTGVLLCMHEGLSSHARAVIGEIESQLAQFRGTDLPWADARVLAPPVRRNIKLAEAPSFGQTIFDYAPHCPGAEDYRQLALALLRGWGIEPAEFEQQRPRRARARARVVARTDGAQEAPQRTSVRSRTRKGGKVAHGGKKSVRSHAHIVEAKPAAARAVAHASKRVPKRAPRRARKGTSTRATTRSPARTPQQPSRRAVERALKRPKSPPKKTHRSAAHSAPKSAPKIAAARSLKRAPKGSTKRSFTRPSKRAPGRPRVRASTRTSPHQPWGAPLNLASSRSARREPRQKMRSGGLSL